MGGEIDRCLKLEARVSSDGRERSVISDIGVELSDCSGVFEMLKETGGRGSAASARRRV